MAQVGIDVARGMGYLHTQGILHLDIKPSNVLMEKNSGGGGMLPGPYWRTWGLLGG